MLQDCFRLLTPGGGGYGVMESKQPPRKRRRTDPIASHYYQEKGSVHAYKLAQESA